MAAADVQTAPTEPAPSVPDYVLDPNAVLKDSIGSWRYGRAPDYSKTRSYFEETKSKDHVTGSLESIVENLVKNWEVEASFKTQLSDWRTIDHANYSFAMNGGPGQTGEHMLKVGTYNAIVAPNEYYSPKNSDFASSHKTFKRMMPTFAWEVLEVYSGPPVVSFRWRHWGVMKNDYVGFNDKAEKVTAKAHGGTIDIQGVTVATVNAALKVQKLETWFDSMEMFRQIAPNGIINKEAMREEGDETNEETNIKQVEQTSRDGTQSDVSTAGGIPESNPADERAASANTGAPDTTNTASTPLLGDPAPSIYSSAVTGNEEPKDPSKTNAESTSAPDEWDEMLSKPADVVHPFRKDIEERLKPGPGDAVAAHADSAEAKSAYEEMSRVTSAQCPFMNKE